MQSHQKIHASGDTHSQQQIQAFLVAIRLGQEPQVPSVMYLYTI